MFRGAWLDHRVKEGLLEVDWDERRPFGYRDPRGERALLELARVPSWHELQFRRSRPKRRSQRARLRSGRDPGVRPDSKGVAIVGTRDAQTLHRRVEVPTARPARSLRGLTPSSAIGNRVPRGQRTGVSGAIQSTTRLDVRSTTVAGSR